MADLASSTITISAPPDEVMAVIADIDRYPEWTGQIKSAEVLETGADGKPAQARFVMDAGVLKDEYILRVRLERRRRRLAPRRHARPCRSRRTARTPWRPAAAAPR